MTLRWSRLALADLRALRRYSRDRWGNAVATGYEMAVREAAVAAAARPDRTRQLRGSLRLVRVRSHYLIVDVDDVAARLTVARVLHSAMDLMRHLP